MRTISINKIWSDDKLNRLYDELVSSEYTEKDNGGVFNTLLGEDYKYCSFEKIKWTLISSKTNECNISLLHYLIIGMKNITFLDNIKNRSVKEILHTSEKEIIAERFSANGDNIDPSTLSMRVRQHYTKDTADRIRNLLEPYYKC